MFEAGIYKDRRKLLKNQLGSGLALFLGNEECPMNYAANTYPFRQDSSFLYFFGLDTPGLAGIVDADENRDIVFGTDIGIEDIIWMGYIPTIRERALEAGVKHTKPLDKLPEVLKKARENGRTVHYLPPYRAENKVKIGDLLGIPVQDVKAGASAALTKAVVAQRSIKSAEEVREIEKALGISCEMYTLAMHVAKPGIYEREVAGAMEGIALSLGGACAFPLIVTVDGQTLHNHYHGNKMKKGQLLVMDAGAESTMHYASDITRTIPIGGKFSARQKEIYEIVLEGQLAAIKAMKPGVGYREIHLNTALIMARRLKEAGLMTGDTDEAVRRGAHALFFPHGLGHMIGLDVHDMEDIGENHVGYDEKTKRSDQFGLAYLRMAKELRPGHVITVEPGLYFIPALIDKWRGEKKHAEFIKYDKVETYKHFGGIRIEDNVLVTEKGHRVLGWPIPKTVKEVEAATR
jgi:Xaa-Pro aminopeptidase